MTCRPPSYSSLSVTSWPLWATLAWAPRSAAAVRPGMGWSGGFGPSPIQSASARRRRLDSRVRGRLARLKDSSEQLWPAAERQPTTQKKKKKKNKRGPPRRFPYFRGSCLGTMLGRRTWWTNRASRAAPVLLAAGMPGRANRGRHRARPGIGAPAGRVVPGATAPHPSTLDHGDCHCCPRPGAAGARSRRPADPERAQNRRERRADLRHDQACVRLGCGAPWWVRGFEVGAILKFKAHKDNPRQTVLGKPTALVFIGASIAFIDKSAAIAGASLFGQASQGTRGRHRRAQPGQRVLTQRTSTHWSDLLHRLHRRRDPRARTDASEALSRSSTRSQSMRLASPEPARPRSRRSDTARASAKAGDRVADSRDRTAVIRSLGQEATHLYN